MEFFPSPWGFPYFSVLICVVYIVHKCFLTEYIWRTIARKKCENYFWCLLLLILADFRTRKKLLLFSFLRKIKSISQFRFRLSLLLDISIKIIRIAFNGKIIDELFEITIDFSRMGETVYWEWKIAVAHHNTGNNNLHIMDEKLQKIKSSDWARKCISEYTKTQDTTHHSYHYY